ncbi:MAG TPA: outer membrane beta-barrel protein [Luteibacter sp.]|uniref:outer membrane beta-barrel protein n=1 Tax=Luteibacter sp. TaxID=1886636 RepID=UPI002B69B63B|nr:outer membrane beta-barrel protein [Luteibacter sp.]HVI56854.1 outer membrane beta-barrel protein [Luteibacter sp.]
MEKRLLTAAAAAVLSLASFGAQAANEGTFIGINGGRADYDINHTGFQDKNDTAFGAVVGYRWAVDRPFYFGVEAGYVDLGKISSKYSYGGITYGETDAFKLKGKAVLVGANGKWELPHHWTITARLGLAHSRTTYDIRSDLYQRGPNGIDTTPYATLKSHNTSTDNGIYAGVGFGYDFTPNFGVAVNYDNYSLKAQNITDDKRTVNVGVWGASAEFRF